MGLGVLIALVRSFGFELRFLLIRLKIISYSTAEKYFGWSRGFDYFDEEEEIVFRKYLHRASFLLIPLLGLMTYFWWN